MDLIWIFTVLSVLAQALCDEDEIDIAKLKFSEESSKEILRKQWSVFGETNHRTPPSIYQNFVSPVSVQTPMGQVKGILTKSSKNALPYAAFFGMPYAKPPIGNLRFTAPLPAEPWKGTYDATYERPFCLQFQSTMKNEDEDCLYINVYTPNYDLKYKPLAVMVFIYGGAFIGGSSNSSVYSPDFLVEKNVVLVTFNYRLGVLGFLSLQNEAVPGNAGLKDQVLALQWVQKNIASFGGDPNRVTIFGESAGAASVNYHILSPSSKGLFHRAIMQSGVSNAPWAFVPKTEVLRLAKELAKRVGCTNKCMDEMLSCLRELPASKLIDEQQGTLGIQDILHMRPFAFVPTEEPKVSGAFLTEAPGDLLVQGKFNSVPVIIGSNSGEGLIVLPVLKQVDPIGIGVLLIGLDLSLFYPYELRAGKTFMQKREIHNKIHKFYFGNKPVTLFAKENLINLITDTSFTMPIQHTTALLANSTSPVYNYVFSYNGPYGIFKTRLNLLKEKGVCHGDELGYLFYDHELHPVYSETFNQTEYENAERVVNYFTSMWTDFAKTGHPTPKKNDLITTEWNSRSDQRFNYMNIGDTMELKSEDDGLLKGRIDFWYDLVH